jgi:hypothetical protein
MNTPKLKLVDVEVESFATATVEDVIGTVEANMLTLKGQTVLCTQCGNLQCGA